MTLLAEIIHSHGGADLWRRLRRFSARMPIDGVLLAGKGKADTLKDVVVDGSTRDQFLRFTGFTAPDRRATYRPDRVTVESLDGQVLAARDEPCAAFAGHTDSTWAQEEFSGIIAPTQRSAFRIASNGRVIADPPSVTVELHDVAFE